MVEKLGNSEPSHVKEVWSTIKDLEKVSERNVKRGHVCPEN
jgi:hypothetical protein